MAISLTLQQYLEGRKIDFELVPHKHTDSSSSTAEAAHVGGDSLAKAVMLEDEEGFLMAVIPATHRLNLGVLHNTLDRQLGLATEGELQELFPDCDQGAIPPIGEAYGVESIVDEILLERPEIWFEAGDHEDLIHVTGEQFKSLLGDTPSGRISTHR